jgi:hypothetical protein
MIYDIRSLLFLLLIYESTCNAFNKNQAKCVPNQKMNPYLKIQLTNFLNFCNFENSKTSKNENIQMKNSQKEKFMRIFAFMTGEPPADIAPENPHYVSTNLWAEASSQKLRMFKSVRFAS